MRNVLTRPEFWDCYNPLGLSKNCTSDELWSKAQAFAIQWTQHCQNCGYTAPEVTRSFGSKAPTNSYGEAAFECAQIIVMANSRNLRRLNGGLLCTEH